jgi:hypothetical protein
MLCACLKRKADRGQVAKALPPCKKSVTAASFHAAAMPRLVLLKQLLAGGLTIFSGGLQCTFSTGVPP